MDINFLKILHILDLIIVLLLLRCLRIPDQLQNYKILFPSRKVLDVFVFKLFVPKNLSIAGVFCIHDLLFQNACLLVHFFDLVFELLVKVVHEVFIVHVYRFLEGFVIEFIGLVLFNNFLDIFIINNFDGFLIIRHNLPKLLILPLEKVFRGPKWVIINILLVLEIRLDLWQFLLWPTSKLRKAFWCMKLASHSLTARSFNGMQLKGQIVLKFLSVDLLLLSLGEKSREP